MRLKRRSPSPDAVRAVDAPAPKRRARWRLPVVLSMLAAIPAAADPVFEQAALAARPDPEWGAHLAADCLSCHRAAAAAAGIPVIAGRPRDAFIHALAGYRSGDRRHPVMEMVARNLAPEEAGVLAAYFETLLN